MLRIVSGIYKGQKLSAPKGRETRPTLQKTRETIFNIVSSRYSLEKFEIIDLFAGSGAMGLEALSRGAQNAIFVDINRAICRIIQKNIEKLKAEKICLIYPQDAIKWIQQHDWSEKPKIFFLDPPYNSNLDQQALELLANPKYSIGESLVILETSKYRRFEYPERLQIFRTKAIGKTKLDFFTITD